MRNKYSNATNSILQKAVRNKDILWNENKVEVGEILTKGDKLKISDFLFKILKQEKTEKIKSKADRKVFESCIIYEDEHIIALNKPTGLAVQSGSKIENCVADYLVGEEKLVHRLDKDTSGVLVIAKNRESADILSEYFKEKDKLTKTYLALTIGKFNRESGEINLPLLKKYDNGVEKVYVDKNGKEAITLYKVLNYNEKHNISWVEVQIMTGRTHQIRVHLKELGHPILGDGKYGSGKVYLEYFSRNLHLHSYKLTIRDFYGKDVELKAKIPDYFVKDNKRLGFLKK